jgi:hypothetical protein
MSAAHARLMPGLVVLLAVTGCGLLREAGPVRDERRTLEAVTSVELRASGDLTISAGEPAVLTITAGANQLPELTSEVRDRRLILDANSSLPSGDYSYALVVPQLDGVTVAGSGSARGDAVAEGQFTAEVSGSGSLTLTNVDATSVTARLDGSGNLQMSGTAAAQTVELSGSGGYDGANLTTGDATVTVSGSGDASVNVTDRLTAEISGSGSIDYTGSPDAVDRSISGSGDITGG